MAAILAAARNANLPGYDAARRIVCREHYRVLYERNPDDIAVNPEAAKAVYDATRKRYNDTHVHYDSYREKKRAIDFPVLTRDGRISSCLALSETLNQVPVVAVDFVFIAPHLRKEASEWLQSELSSIIAPKGEEEP